MSTSNKIMTIVSDGGFWFSTVFATSMVNFFTAWAYPKVRHHCHHTLVPIVKHKVAPVVKVAVVTAVTSTVAFIVTLFVEDEV